MLGEKHIQFIILNENDELEVLVIKTPEQVIVEGTGEKIDLVKNRW